MSTLYWENFDRPYDSFEKEGLNLDDFQVKSKLAFNNGKNTFSSKSKFNFGQKNSAAHEYGIVHKCPKGVFDFKHKAAGETTLESDIKTLQKEKVTLKTYSKLVLNQKGEGKKDFAADILLRIHHQNNALLAFGVENWDALNGSPKTVSVYTSYGHRANSAEVIFNTYFNYNIAQKFLPQAKFLLSGTQGDLAGYLQANVNGVQVNQENDTNKPLITQNSFDVILKLIKIQDLKTKFGTAVKYNVDTKKTDAAIFASHVLDRVKLNAKVATDNSLTVGVTSVFDDVTLNFSAKSTLNNVEELTGETKTKKYYTNYKFGYSVEFNRV